MKIDGVICLLERVIYEYVGHLRARTPTINVSVATHDPFWFSFVCAFIHIYWKHVFEKSAIIINSRVHPRKSILHDAYTNWCANAFEKLTFHEISTHTYGTTANKKTTNGLQFQFNSLTKYGNVYTIKIFTPFGFGSNAI